MKDNKITINVTEEISLINAISNKLKDMSNKTIKNYVKNDMVYVNNKIEHNTSRILNKDDEITFYFQKGDHEKIKLHIIYEDTDIIVIDKPANLLSISNSNERLRTAYRLVSDYVKKTNKNNKIYVIHRLDEKTSGILMFAKNIKVQETFQKNWGELVKVREYEAVIPFKIPNKGTIKSYLKVNRNQIVHSVKNPEEGYLAITNYELVKYKNGYSLVKVLIETGKRNQIRVHMKENFRPIVGDTKYGSTDNCIHRLALHASKLVLTDPRTNKELVFESPVPSEILNLVK